MIEIARSSQEEGILQKDIATNQGISYKYLDHIIHALKVAGLVCNVRGKKSGYILTRPAEEITAYEIHKAFEAGICVVDCINNGYKCDRRDGCEARGFWGELNNRIYDYFNSVTLQELSEKKEVPEEFRS